MVDQVTKSGLSIYLMGTAGYAFGHLNGMDPKITALVWMIADLAKHIFDYIAIQRQASDEDFNAIRGGIFFVPPVALLALKQFSSPVYMTAIVCFFAFATCLYVLDDLSPFAGRNVHPIPTAPVGPPPPPAPPHPPL
jgi:hypothetical protein